MLQPWDSPGALNDGVPIGKTTDWLSAMTVGPLMKPIPLTMLAATVGSFRYDIAFWTIGGTPKTPLMFAFVTRLPSTSTMARGPSPSGLPLERFGPPNVKPEL